MNIDERIEALQVSIAKLHESAVVQGVNNESLHSSAAEQQGNIAELRASIADLGKKTAELYAIAVQDGINIRTLAESVGSLARITEVHGNRLTNLEGGRPNLH